MWRRDIGGTRPHEAAKQQTPSHIYISNSSSNFRPFAPLPFC